MQTEDNQKLEAAKFLEQSQDFAHKIGELAKSEGVSTTVFIFSILASADALKKMSPNMYQATEEFFKLLSSNERGN